MDGNLAQYLKKFTAKANVAELPIKTPGKNWSPLPPLVTGSHVSLSVSKNQIQVNLNNEDDAERSKFEPLYADRNASEHEIGEGLTWEQKNGRKKTAIRAAYEAGYADPDSWDAQHAWAIATMSKFQDSFGRRLG